MDFSTQEKASAFCKSLMERAALVEGFGFYANTNWEMEMPPIEKIKNGFYIPIDRDTIGGISEVLKSIKNDLGALFTLMNELPAETFLPEYDFSERN